MYGSAALQNLFTGTKVVMLVGGRPKAITILYRTILRITPFGFLLYNENEPGQTLHDRLPGTAVIDLKKYRQAQEQKNEIEEIGKKEI